MPEPSERPRIAVPMTPVRLVLEALAAAALIGLIVYVATVWTELPERIPAQFDFSGKPVRWSSRDSMLILPCVGVLVYLLTTICARIPHKHNYTVNVTADNAAYLYRTSVSLLTWIKLEIVLLFGLITWQQVEVAAGRSPGLGPWLIPVVLAVALSTTGVHIYRLHRPPRSAN